jgi:hypothetical protein
MHRSERIHAPTALPPEKQHLVHIIYVTEESGFDSQQEFLFSAASILATGLTHPSVLS